jgi:arsenate reductase
MKFYQYPRCSTCRKAQKWLDDHGVDVDAIDIVRSPPSRAQLEKARKLSGLGVSKLFNTSGQAYREGGYSARLKTMTDKQALSELASNGKLIKRPLLVGDGFALVGFKAEQYAEALT